jgi:DNA-binding MarR family transcriptional regulator
MSYYRQFILNNIIPEQNDAPYARNIRSPDDDAVKKNPGIYDIRNCRTCGRLMAQDRFHKQQGYSCSSVCGEIWKYFNAKGVKTEDKLILYYYRITVKKDLTKLTSSVKYHDYTPVELSILDQLSTANKTSSELTFDIFGEEYLSDGNIRRRNTIVKALERLIKKGRVRRTRNFTNGRGRPASYFVLTKKILRIDKKCPNCGSYRYYFDDINDTVTCLFCSLEWKREMIEDGKQGKR